MAGLLRPEIRRARHTSTGSLSLRSAVGILDRLYAYPRVLLAVTAIALLAAAVFWPRFSFDASSDTLVVEGDPELAYYFEIAQRFGGDEFLILTYRPYHEALFTRPVIERIQRLQAEVEAVSGVASVFSILDAPLLRRANADLSELAEQIVTVADPEADLDAAREELSASPVFSDLLVSRDGSTTALRIDIAPDTELDRLWQRRNELRQISNPTAEQTAELRGVNSAYRDRRQVFLAERDALIANIRAIRDRHGDDAELYLGGVPMIAADMIEYVRSDVVVFGGGAGVLIVIMLWLFFRRLRWIVLPLATSAVTIGLVTGWLGLIEQPVTVISSNFISLLAIITISLTIHLIVRYRELSALEPEQAHHERVLATMRTKFAPCLYTALTTIVAFASLAISQIVPVRDFGWMMSVGVALSFVVTFVFFPAILLALGPGKPDARADATLGLTSLLSRTARRHHRVVIGTGVAITIVAALGIVQLGLDNRFIDYFREDTEIRQGMAFIDRNLGGTIPFDVVISFPPYQPEELDEDDDFFFDDEPDAYPERYWFTPDKIATVAAIQRYIAEQPQVGSLTSLADLEAVAREFNNGRPLDALELTVVLSAIPEQFRAEMIEPYASPATGEMRISGRIQETGPYVDREAFIAGINAFAQRETGLDAGDVRVTGMLVLFHDTLQHLFSSQTQTIGYVVGLTLLMFWVLLRSLTLAMLGVAPIVLAAGTVLGIMGYLGIPLDLMTITIAAISVGIGVDNAIHYLHRYLAESNAGHDARESVRRAHDTIGSAIYYTGITIIVGFSLLAFSNFVPTIYFGLLVATAMGLAMLANLALLPSLLVGVFGRRTLSEDRTATT
jgi:uncharacterized protein